MSNEAQNEALPEVSEMKQRPKPVVLVILDGWGVAPPSRGNAVTLANTPTMDKLIATYPTTTLRASGEAVGLPWGERGNSEVGHLSLGSGRVIYQNLSRITKSILDKSFFNNSIFLKAIKHVKKNNSSLHFLGLISNSAVHSHIEHLYALLELAKSQKIEKVYIHGILDGRDMPFNSGLDIVSHLKERLDGLGVGKIATLSGRWWAMDRDNHWDRIEKAYLAMTEGESDKQFSDPVEAIKASYNKKIYDEEFVPVIITEGNNPVAKVQEEDAVIFFNYRVDRVRQITKAFVLPTFEKFSRGKYLKNIFFVTMTEYERDLPVEVAFPSSQIETPLAKVLSIAGLTQLHIAETEKYAHVTYFFNGGQDVVFEGEDRILIPSPQVSSYDQKPEMSAREITQKVIQVVSANKYDFIVVNFANPDMVGHTGNLEASIKAVEIVDKCLGEIIESVLFTGGVVTVTADHGNIEELLNLQIGAIDKEHSTNPVPFILVGNQWQGKTAGFPSVPGNDLSLISPQGVIVDVAPTILKTMDFKQPQEMTGRPLI